MDEDKKFSTERMFREDVEFIYSEFSARSFSLSLKKFIEEYKKLKEA